MSSSSALRQRLRVTFGKSGFLVYIGHLDLARVWERLLRRARLPLAYSHGFNPRPRLQLADALPLGISSECELIDIWLKEPAPIEGLARRLQDVAPEGLTVHAFAKVPPKGPALQTLMAAADYVITFLEEDMDAEDLAERVRGFLSQPRVERVRRGTRKSATYDLRPLVRNLATTSDGALHATLSLGEAGTARPDELLDALGLSGALVAVHRRRLHLRGQRVLIGVQ
jgi:radical SAM-linked protein